jgi:hypothetical protein
MMQQVILDAHAPILSSIQVSKPPSAAEPLIQLSLLFSEPVQWLASSASGPNPSVVAAAGAANNTMEPSTATNFSSSGILLTNAVLLNMTATENSTALWADQQPTGAATEYRMWLQSWPGATAAVVVLGVAYQDLAGNPGQQNQQLQVQK